MAVAAVQEAEEGRALHRAAEVEAHADRHLLRVLRVDHVGVPGLRKKSPGLVTAGPV